MAAAAMTEPLGVTGEVQREGGGGARAGPATRGPYASAGASLDPAARVSLKAPPFAHFNAELVRVAIHIFFLIGFRNRLLVMINWAYAYVTLRGGARLITGDPPAPLL